ncbi:hypothetical protein T484DRAFT_2022929 [Baffinella frigidus]|nr:hypothetical protein T484DRAFT_2022929 [Cryptophyta sp. CCMP2293]
MTGSLFRVSKIPLSADRVDDGAVSCKPSAKVRTAFGTGAETQQDNQHTNFLPRSMPFSSPADAATRKPSHLHVIVDGIRKRDEEFRPRILARLSAHSVDDETFAMEQSAPSSPGASNIGAWAPATEKDKGSVERPEDICICDDWDLEEAMIQLEDAGEIVWNGTEERARTDDIGCLLLLLDDNAAPSSDVEDAAGLWWSPCCSSF